MGVPRLQGRIEGHIDLNGIEKLRQISRFVEAFWTRRRVHITGPVRIRPARRPDANVAGMRNGTPRRGLAGKLRSLNARFAAGGATGNAFRPAHRSVRAIGTLVASGPLGEL